MSYKDPVKNREAARKWYAKNKARLAYERKRANFTDEEIWNYSPYREFSETSASLEDEGYTYLDFLIDTETD